MMNCGCLLSSLLSLRHSHGLQGAAVPNLNLEDWQECLKLAQLWSTKGLLDLFDEPPPEGYLCRVLNCLKDERHDRQIGDRRFEDQSNRHLREVTCSHHYIALQVPPCMAQ